jgi:hypothetical protein
VKAQFRLRRTNLGSWWLIGWAWLRRTKFVLKNNEKDKKTFSTYRLKFRIGFNVF